MLTVYIRKSPPKFEKQLINGRVLQKCNRKTSITFTNVAQNGNPFIMHSKIRSSNKESLKNQFETLGPLIYAKIEQWGVGQTSEIL